MNDSRSANRATKSIMVEQMTRRSAAWRFAAGCWVMCVALVSAAAAGEPSGKLAEIVELGRVLVEQTAEHPLTRKYVGAALNCTFCHLDNGTHPTAASFLDVATAYPAWAGREGRVITLEDRVLNCFMRSCNGIRPPQGSQPVVAIVT